MAIRELVDLERSALSSANALLHYDSADYLTGGAEVAR